MSSTVGESFSHEAFTDFFHLFQLIVDSETSELKSLLGPKGSDAAHIQECCQRHLDDREKTMEAMQLLKMMDSKSANTDTGSSPKRKKIE